ncbi:MAG: TonB-dependent receptor [Methylocella sp.]
MRTRKTWSFAAAAALGTVAFVQTARAQDITNLVALPEVDVVAPTPVPGAGGLEKDKVPAFVSTVTGQEFEDKKSPAVADAITAHVPAAIAISVDGSDLSPDVFYRGFDTSRISGTAQGLAVYQNGVRINEAFGDATNLDLISPIAIDRLDVYTNNPIFGLNALGGAFNFTMKNGFTYQGGEAQIYGGSYGRVYGSLQYGKQVDNYSFYFATDAERDDGYRPFGAQNLQRAYADLGYRTPDSEFHAIGSFGRSLLGVQGVTPQVLVNQDYTAAFTTPQTTNNQAGLAQVTGRFDLWPKWSLASNFYFRQFDQYHYDGNDASIQNCGDIVNPDGTTGTPGASCLPPSGAFSGSPASDYQFTNHGQPIPFLGYNFPYGTTAYTATHSQQFGTQQQITSKDKILDHDNYFVFGGSVDQSYTHYSSTTTLGVLEPNFQNIFIGIPGSGALLQTQGNVGFSPVWVHSTSTYFGVFTLDTFNITKELALTAGARYNVANIDLNDASGEAPNNNTSNSYSRINPVVGLAYNILPTALTVYGGYSEANRAPTPSENNCSNPQQPCLLEYNLVSDPPLKQVVSHTIEAGARGLVTIPDNYGALAYKVGYFHITNTNDILSESSTITGTGYYVNVPETLRQGVEVGLQYNNGPVQAYANYAYVNATYQFNGTFSSPSNPFADANGNVYVRPGDNITGIPRNLAKLGVTYAVTPQFKVNAEGVFVGSQYYVGDPSNQFPQLPAYYFVNLRGTYQVNDNVQIFGMINNVTNNHYATYGTFYDTGTTAQFVNQTLVNNANATNPNPRSITVAQPISFYAGAKVTF